MTQPFELTTRPADDCVALCARDRRHPQSPGELQGLPETLDSWRHGIASRENRTGEPVNAADLEKILSIKAAFFSALPAVRASCERALLENEDAEAALYLLSGIAAADGLLSIARLLHYGDEGWFTCSSCGAGYDFMLFGDVIIREKSEYHARTSEQMERHLTLPPWSLRQKVALSCRILAGEGHESALAGQITARGDRPGTYWMLSFGLGFDEARASNIVLVDDDVQLLQGDGMVNPSNRFHLWIYRHRPNVKAIVHTHPRSARRCRWSASRSSPRTWTPRCFTRTARISPNGPAANR